MQLIPQVWKRVLRKNSQLFIAALLLNCLVLSPANAKKDQNLTDPIRNKVVEITPLENLPEANRFLPKNSASLSQLLHLWSVFGSPLHSACGQISIGHLRCFVGYGDLAELSNLNRPALLDLTYQGRPLRVLLTKIEDDEVTLMGESRAYKITTAELEQLWTGRFTMIWRSPAKQRLIHSGEHSVAANWLRQRLIMALSHSEANISWGQQVSFWRSQQSLADTLRYFQLLVKLKPDGLAGPRTQIMLNTATSLPIYPVLRQPDQS